jgi:hypothetical protein
MTTSVKQEQPRGCPDVGVEANLGMGATASRPSIIGGFTNQQEFLRPLVSNYPGALCSATPRRSPLPAKLKPISEREESHEPGKH